MAHLLQAKQCNTAAPSQGVGGSNAVGTSTALSRADHDHTIRETGGPTNLTVGVVADGQFLKRVGSAIVGGASPSGLATKSGMALVAAFTGNPKKATVTFATPFADAMYCPLLTPETSGNTGFGPVINSMTASGFVINMNTNNVTNLIAVHWVATYHGET